MLSLPVLLSPQLCGSRKCVDGPKLYARLPAKCRSGHPCFHAKVAAYANLFGSVYSIMAHVSPKQQLITAEGVGCV